jgi:hypothetical protein
MTDASETTILASAFGSLVALVGLVVSKESKISEFRQKWIDDLRADISSFIALALVAQTKLSPDKLEDFYMRANEMNGRITLRFKHGDEQSRPLLNELSKLIDSAKGRDSSATTKTTADAVVREAQLVLGTEWKRVKRGETSYRLLVGATVCVLITSFATALWFFRRP